MCTYYSGTVHVYLGTVHLYSSMVHVYLDTVHVYSGTVHVYLGMDAILYICICTKATPISSSVMHCY